MNNNDISSDALAIYRNPRLLARLTQRGYQQLTYPEQMLKLKQLRRKPKVFKAYSPPPPCLASKRNQA